MPQGWSLHSTYHVHPSGDRSTQFSDDDINTAKQLKAPSYVLALDDNKIRMFDPTSSKVLRDFSDKNNMRSYSNGSLVDETPPTPSPTTPPAAAASPPPTQAPPMGDTPAATVPVAGSRITMKDFAARHRATKYKPKTVHIR